MTQTTEIADDLTPCRSCNHHVAKDARTCPNCGKGFPVGEPIGKQIMLTLIFVPLFLAIFFGSALLLGPLSIFVLLLLVIVGRQIAKAHGLH